MVSERSARPGSLVSSRCAAVRESVVSWTKATRSKISRVVVDKSFQVTAASAVGGATFVGTGGAATGLAAGGALGFVVGVAAAPLTLGLSIPIAAAVGGSCGFVSGAAAGGAAGGVGGAAVGYGAYARRQAIGSAASTTLKKVDSFTKTIKDGATESALHVRARLIGATGGSA